MNGASAQEEKAVEDIAYTVYAGKDSLPSTTIWLPGLIDVIT